VSSITVELTNGTNIRNALTDIKDSVDSISFPEDVEDPNIQEISATSKLLFQVLLYGSKQEYTNFRLM